MIHVTVALTNGNIVGFDAEEFNVNLANSASGVANKFTYKDHQGNDSAVHLKPEEVAGIFVTPSEGAGGSQAIWYAVAGRR